jgi:ribonuclease Z
LRRIFGRLTYEYELVEHTPGDVLSCEGYELRTFGVDHGVSAVGYAFVERARPGRFDVDVADALGVPPGPERGALQAGEAVSVAGGRVVTPDELLGPPRPGRKLVLTGDTAPCRGVVEAAKDADVLVHEATFLEDERERARDTAHSTAADAAGVALEAGVGLLALTHLSNRYSGREAADEARPVFADTVVPRDFDTIDLPFSERGAPRLVKGGAVHRRDEGAPVEVGARAGEETGS